MINALITLSENEKRLLIAIAIVVILLFVIAGYVGLAVQKLMSWQGKRASKMMYNVTKARVVVTPKEFIRFGRKKNNRIFFQQAWIPLVILCFAGLIYLIYGATSNNWTLNIWDYKKEGFSTILFLWDFDKAPHSEFFGMMLISGWPPLLNSPHWEWTAWASYLIVPCLFVGGGWYLVSVQAYIARAYKIHKLAKEKLGGSLEDSTEFNN